MIRSEARNSIFLYGARCALGPRQSECCSIEIRRGRIHDMVPDGEPGGRASCDLRSVELSGFLILPGLINAHDHLEFALYPRLAASPYPNYIEWGRDIHQRFSGLIAAQHSVPKDVRVWWGAVRNLLCGATTVSHHNPLHPAMRDAAFPVRVMRHLGWAHSPALGGDLRRAHAMTREGAPFVLHACEGTDEAAQNELWELDRLDLLDSSTVVVHGLALDQAGVDRLTERRASLIVCPSSNQFLFAALPNLALLSSVPHLTLGNDSPLTAEGDLLDEIRFLIRFCGTTAETAWTMVTQAPATVLRLRKGEGTLERGGVGDVVAVRDTGGTPADTLSSLTMRDVELVIVGGRVQMSSHTLFQQLAPGLRHGLEPLIVDGVVRWLRAPVQYLLRRAEQVLGAGQVRLGNRTISTPVRMRYGHVS